MMINVQTILALLFVNLPFNDAQYDLHKVIRKGFGVGSEPLHLVSENDYIGRISIGSPPQSFHVAFDINLGNVWVPDIECECTARCNLKLLCKSLCKAHCCKPKKAADGFTRKDVKDGILVPVCDRHSKYDSASSSSYRQDDRHWEISYTGGKAAGKLARDSLTMGNTLTLPQTTIGLAIEFPDIYKTAQYDGVYGLSRESTVQYDKLESPIFQAIRLGLLDEPMISLWLDKNGQVGDTEPDGFITFGGVDNNHCGLISEFIPTINDVNWRIMLKKIRIADYVVDREWTVELDMSYPFIGGPRSSLDQLSNSMKATYDHFADVYYIDCNAQFDLILQFGRNEYPISSDQLVYKNKQNKEGLCVLGFQNYYNIQIDWKLGSPFLRQYCLTLDFGGKIGISIPYSTRHF